MGPESPSLDDLVQRMATLERKYGISRLTIASSIIAFAISAGTLAVCGVAPNGLLRRTSTVEAQQFILRDAGGHIRGELQTTSDGATIFSAGGKEGTGGVQLISEANGPARVALIDKKGQTRAQLQLAADDVVSLAFWDGNAKRRAVLDAAQDEGAELALFDRNEKIRARLALESVGSALALTDVDGKGGVNLHQTNGIEGLSLLGHDGHLRATLAVWLNEMPAMVLYDQDGKVLFAQPDMVP